MDLTASDLPGAFPGAIALLRELAELRWDATHAPYSLMCHGKLMNANHRCRACRRAARELANLRRLLSHRLEWIDSELDATGSALREVDRKIDAIYGFTSDLETRLVELELLAER